jgi:predicted dehydrogenase
MHSDIMKETEINVHERAILTPPPPACYNSRIMSRLRVGVIGCGVLGSRHAEIYRQLPDVDVVAVVDPLEAKAETLARALGTRAFSRVQDCVGMLDAASVCTPAVSHHEVARPLIEAGVHLLVEKPITSRLEDADDLIALAAAKKTILQTGHIERFNGAVSTVKRLVHNPVFIECDRIGPYDPRISDVGVVLDLMIHDIDIVLDLVQSPVRSVEAVGMNLFSQREDFAHSRILFENGTVANLTASRMAQKRLRKIRIFDTDQYFSLDYFQQELLTLTRKRVAEGQNAYEPVPVVKSQPLDEEVKSFVAAVRGSGTKGVSGADGRAALAVALQILDQINSKKVEKISA